MKFLDHPNPRRRMRQRPLAATLAAFIWLMSAQAQAAADKPLKTEVRSAAAAGPHAGASAAAKRKPAAPVKLVDINGATRAELKTLPGIGDAEADKIIANRPYLTKAELVTKQVLPTGPFLTLKSRVIALQKGAVKARKPAAAGA